jgi:preprotein translocase subunit SecG
MLHTLVLVIHVVACLALIAIVLLQTGRGAEMGAAFGGSSQTLFGSSGGSTFLGKLTTAAAIVFMITCLGLTYFSAKPEGKSVMEKVKVEEKQSPVIPEAKPVKETPSAAAPSSDGAAAAQQTTSNVGSDQTAGQPANPTPLPDNPTAPAPKP